MKTKMACLLIAVSALFFGCNQPDDGAHVDPITVYEKVNGSWGLMSLKMVDEFAKANSLPSFEENISTMFNYPDFKIDLNVDDKMAPTTYQVSGNVPPLFSPSGYWSLSTDFQPTNSTGVKIYLFSDAEKTVKTDELLITSTPGSNDEMEIQLQRVSGGTLFLSYVFKLTAIN